MVPGFRTRNNTTTVELPSGGSVASAGLISTQTQQTINGFPALMDIPVLGALFRSRDYQRNETELLIVVTPYIVHAVDPNQIVRPDQNFQDASDPQSWFLGRVNRIYSDLKVAPADAALLGQDRIHHTVEAPRRFARIFAELRRTAVMAALRDARRTFAARVLSSGFAAAAACSLSGCGGVDYASSAPAFPGDFQERHPIVVASAPTSLDIYPVGGALDRRSVANIRAFVQRYRHFGSGIVTILAPAGTPQNSKAVHEVRSALADAGLTGKVAFGTYALLIAGPAAPIRLSFTGLKAVVPTALRSVAGGPRFRIVARRVEERTLLELRMRHPVDDSCSGRRSPRFRPSARARPLRRRDAHKSDRGRPQRPRSRHAVEGHGIDSQSGEQVGGGGQ